jgi:hypothetical protein
MNAAYHKFISIHSRFLMRVRCTAEPTLRTPGRATDMTAPIDAKFSGGVEGRSQAGTGRGRMPGAPRDGGDNNSCQERRDASQSRFYNSGGASRAASEGWSLLGRSAPLRVARIVWQLLVRLLLLLPG